MKSSINTLLIGLVSCDSLLILTSIFLFSFTTFRHSGSALFNAYYWHVYQHILPIVYPIGLTAQVKNVPKPFVTRNYVEILHIFFCLLM